MRILNVINVRWYNATAWYAVSLSSALKCKGHDVAVCGLPGSPPVLKARDAGLETFEAGINTSNPLKVLAAMGAMDRILMSYRPDIIIANRGEFFGYLAWKRISRQNFNLVRVRGDIRPPRNGFFNRIMHNRCTDAIICSGEFIAESYRKNLKTPDSALNVVYGGVDTKKFKKSEFARIKVRDEFGFSLDDHVVGIVGRFDPVKGHGNLIKAVGKVYREGRRNIRLVIAGFDAVSQTESIKKMIYDNGIEDITIITGFREDIADIYNSFDVCVVSSLGSEAICRVGMEAMACGVPLITSDTGVLPEISKNVYPKNDWEKLSELLTDYDPSVTVYSLDDFASAFQKIMRM
ncbi:MAG: glycosyltransferase family 4 protein [Deferribacterales bacterium]